MLRKVNFYSICIASGLSLLIILAGSRFTDNVTYHPSESRRNIRNFLKTEDGDDNYVQVVPTNPDDGSTDVDRILERSRSRIKVELWNYNFSNTKGSIDKLLMEEGGQPLRNLIISTWRSGTTFLGELLNALPGNFYHYEPLLKYEIIQIRGPPYADEALKLIKKMFNCDFEGMDDYFEYGRTHLHQFNHNTRLWDHCKYKKELCFDPVFTSRFCKIFPFQSMKVVRVRLRLIEKLLKEKQLNLKVVLLVRDPRGVLQSRQHRDFCHPAPDCWRPTMLCADMISDYVAASRLQSEYPGRLMVLRYEDFALKPYNTTYHILNFLNLSVTPSIEDYLLTHTNTDVPGVSSTFRVSREVPFRWKNLLEFSFVETIQEECKEAMALWGYSMAHNASHMASKDFYPLHKYTVH